MEMINPQYCCPGRRNMAILTNIGRIHVAGILAGYCLAVMAARAVVDDGVVIKIGR